MPQTIEPDPAILERNLVAIALRSPRAAEQIRAATPSTEIQFSLAPNGQLVGIMDNRALCSKRKPIDEANTWASQYSPQDAGFLGVLGFGLGYHLKALFETHKNFSVLLCYEPDLALLRAVLERIDHSTWITNALFLLATDPDDAPAITALISNAEAFLATGVEIAPHPASKIRLGESAGRFTSTLLDVVKSTRTHLVTILSNSGFTLRNILMNAGTYAASPGITPLKDACAGRTAILIAAGPSLQRNLALLEDPTIRDRAVIIAVQTMLKPLLERGIKPHFVTALDHHEISKRFYEGLTEEDVQGVRLVIEPKANAAIVEAFPGEILCARENQLDELLGPKLARDMGTIPAGATVAHLNYYLAKHLGCSSIILIGQDLGFTDGQYYASGASIHQVWSGELSQHRSLEMFEWERIARMKSLLRIKQDIHDRPIFTDEQMSTYIAQFESDFQEDARDNTLRIINATEGGVNIAGTEVMTLGSALAECLTDQAFELPRTSHLKNDDPDHARRVTTRIKSILGQLSTIERNSKRTLELIKKAQDSIDDPQRVDKYVKSMHAIRDQVLALHPAFDLVNYYNQKGGLNRFKVDRSIKVLTDLSPTEKQSKQLDRDANNVRWIEISSREVHALLARALRVIEGTAPPLTRDEFADDEQADPTIEITSDTSRRVEAVIFADPELGALGFPRNIAQPIYKSRCALQLTIDRLNTCSNLDGITIISPMPDRIKQLVSANSTVELRIVTADPNTFRARARSIGQARAASSECWRGSIGSLSCYDEALEPTILAQVMDEFNIHAAAIVGPDWCMLDPSLIDRIVARHRADPDRCRVPFSQAVPGIGCCVIDRSAADALATAAKNSSAFASIGAMLGYIPVAPQGDPIASPLCVGVDPLIRDAGVRVIADSTIRVQAMAAAYQGLGDSAMTAGAAVLIKAFTSELNKRQTAPGCIQLELTTSRSAQGLWGAMHAVPEHSISQSQAEQLLKDARTLRDDCTVLFAGRGDPLLHPAVLDIIAQANQLGITSTELRTDLINTNINPNQLIAANLGVLSINVLANTPAVYQTMTGTNSFDQLLDSMQALFNARPTTQLPTPWIVPRITRCDAAYPDIQGFYDRWLTVCGCAVIDPPKSNTSDRIQPLVVPELRAAQLARNTLRIKADGQVFDHTGNPIPNTNALKLGIEQSYKNFRQALDQSTEPHIEPKATTQTAAAL